MSRHVQQHSAASRFLAALCVVAALSGCGSAQEAALDQASQRARTRAQAANDNVVALLGGADYQPADDEELLADTIDRVRGTDANGYVFASRTPGPGQVEIDAGFDDSGDAGLIGPHTHALVRLCVRITGTRPGPVTINDVPCQPFNDPAQPGGPRETISLDG
ncbi:hypothetical protein DFJ67_0833 [Asanoa ferruginea]|uniref:LppA-like lipoprotein n=1 Tax=Asanoa ferruginea TaxID=53367 RepID=A0A3D9ZBV8_9ACTN|nr:hypothetical protein [Asanoa ferruginea]REF94888.1 hypothetical protein DFJ67_0833 [Asanoa ferruginea]GIF45533.1 hypothetical protein Afe04nite_00720 [Asanoa ferruginea]